MSISNCTLRYFLLLVKFTPNLNRSYLLCRYEVEPDPSSHGAGDRIGCLHGTTGCDISRDHGQQISILKLKSIVHCLGQ